MVGVLFMTSGQIMSLRIIITLVIIMIIIIIIIDIVHQFHLCYCGTV
jgi:hypothetical protein